MKKGQQLKHIGQNRQRIHLLCGQKLGPENVLVSFYKRMSHPEKVGGPSSPVLQIFEKPYLQNQRR